MTAPVLRVPLPGPALRPGVVDLDVESSGLHATSFPIEFGWCDDGLVGESFLVRPHPTWSRLVDWSFDSQEVHGISWEMLMDEGVSVIEAVERVIEATRGRKVLSDAPELEERWTLRLFAAAGVPMRILYEPHIGEVGEMLCGAGPAETAMDRFAVAEEIAERAFPHVHRALGDAMGTAALRRFAMDPAYMEVVSKALDDAGLSQRLGRQASTRTLMGGWGG